MNEEVNGEWVIVNAESLKGRRDVFEEWKIKNAKMLKSYESEMDLQ